jgi:hypothetical protein
VSNNIFFRYYDFSFEEIKFKKKIDLANKTAAVPNPGKGFFQLPESKGCLRHAS